jgi:hypothetical protein
VRKIVEKSWLKQLKVAISTGASLPDRSSPQNSKANFVDLRDVGSKKIFFLKVYSIEIHDQQVFQAFLQIFMQNGKVGEGDVFFKEKTYSLPYSHKNFRISSSIITIVSAKFKTKALQHVLVYKHCFQPYH